MKKIILFLLIITSCTSQKKMNNTIEFKILDKSIVDNSFINLEITNHTTSNYYLPIINLSDSEKWRYIISSDERRLFFIFKIGYNSRNEERHWYSENCNSEFDKELDKVDELWRKKRKTIAVKDLILLKSSKSLKIRVPMNLYIKISTDCTWELENYKNEKELKIAINYPKKEKELATKFLSSKTLDSLKQMGYKLYDKEIKSNIVPLILK
ncbi:hypothetical protein [Flavobacterium sp. 140616W15]|uniref:hypothetical protein n=1 Tax=Flavobacterium sp. 140616W15 TaxID=2478552 RepID=UPI000F0CA94F|nr:hypothetical protein [Flavobacterium sp. 140616W15]AYN02989.1 hypothetical protein EAG11_01495 [Flavobacterium sp. 140616W15]